MSDIPPARFSVPELPNEVITKIFISCDAKTLMRAQATSRFWKATLSSYEFVHEIGGLWKRKGCSIVAHLGYTDKSRRSMDWVIKMSSDSGQRFPAALPFVLNHHGWFDIIGIDKGIFCFRVSKTGNFSDLVVWNPMTCREFIVADPLAGTSDETAFLFSFLYFPDSVRYSIVAIFLEYGEEVRCVFTVYDSSLRRWSQRLPSPDYVKKLDPAYVIVNGVTYWVTWSHDEKLDTPPYIVSFSSLTHSFRQITIPEEALTTCHTLLNRDGHLCVAANNHNSQGYTTTIWKIDLAGEEFVWSKLFDLSGNTHSFIPGALVDDDVIQVLERHVDVDEVEGMEYTNIHVRRFFTQSRRTRTLLWVNYEDDVKLRSIHTYYEGFYPV